MNVDSPSDHTLSRVARKKQETRARILAVSEELMRVRPIDQVTIKDITDAADVGHGSFYLHFKSKNEVLMPIIKARAESLDEKIRTAISDVEDPAEIMALSSRFVARMIVSDNLWRWFLQYSGVSLEDMRQVFGRYSERDFYRGYESGRFNVTDIKVTTSYAFGGFINSLLTAFDHEDVERRIDLAVEMLLRVFGISADEARQLAHKSLPHIDGYSDHG